MVFIPKSLAPYFLLTQTRVALVTTQKVFANETDTHIFKVTRLEPQAVQRLSPFQP